MSSSNNYNIQILYNSILYLYHYAIPTFYILGNIGNVLTILIFVKKSWRKNVCVFYFIICLFFNTCYINSSVLGTTLSHFNIDLYDSNRVLCKLYFYSIFSFSTLTPTTLILASIDRLLISSQNVDTRLYSSKRLAYFSVSISTTIWLIYYFHILIKVDIQEIYPSYFICYYNLSLLYLHFISFSSLSINCIFCFIMIILCMFAFKNVQRIRSVPRQYQRQQIRTMTKKDFQLLRCLFVQDIIYIILTIPLSIFTVYQIATINKLLTPLQQAIIDFFNNFLILLHHIPYCSSFYIFIIVSKAFRQELKRIIYNLCGQHLAPIRDEENKQENVVVIVNNIVS